MSNFVNSLEQLLSCAQQYVGNSPWFNSFDSQKWSWVWLGAQFVHWRLVLRILSIIVALCRCVVFRQWQSYWTDGSSRTADAAMCRLSSGSSVSIFAGRYTRWPLTRFVFSPVERIYINLILLCDCLLTRALYHRSSMQNRYNTS